LTPKPKLPEECKLDVAVVESTKGLCNALMKTTEFDIASGRQLTEDEISKAKRPGHSCEVATARSTATTRDAGSKVINVGYMITR